MTNQPSFRPGLEGVVASETEISWLDVESEKIIIRGYDLIELARKVGYIDVAGLLLNRKIPNQEEHEKLEKILREEADVPASLWSIIEQLPSHTDAMDLLRTGISILAAYDEELDDRSTEANQRKALRLLAKIPSLVANGYRIKKLKQSPLLPQQDLTFSGNFLYRLTGKRPEEFEQKIFDQSLTVYSEHEMPNSTFAARIIASTQSDLYGAVTGAVASLKGSWHGGANEAVMHMLLEAETINGVKKLIEHKLAIKERIMGFGHRVYMNKMDPRAALMKEALARLSEAKGDDNLYEMCVMGEKTMHGQKGLYPNLDYYAAPVYYMLGIPIALYTPIFLAARTVGLAAHVIEQHDHNRLFRPRVHYAGPLGLSL